MISTPKIERSGSKVWQRGGIRLVALMAVFLVVQPLATEVRGQQCADPLDFDPTHFVRIGGANWYIELTDNGYSDILIDTRLGFFRLNSLYASISPGNGPPLSFTIR